MNAGLGGTKLGLLVAPDRFARTHFAHDDARLVESRHRDGCNGIGGKADWPEGEGGRNEAVRPHTTK